MKMTLNRDFVVVSRSGLSIEFKKDEPTFVPPRVVQEVLAIGGVIVDRDEAAVASTMNEVQAPEAEAAARAPTIEAAIRKMLERNRRGDFTAGGRPNLLVLFRETGLMVDAKELDPIWAKVRETVE